MVRTCKEKTLSKKHNTEQLSETEKTQFGNCLQKYFEAPNHVMAMMNQQMGGGAPNF